MSTWTGGETIQVLEAGSLIFQHRLLYIRTITDPFTSIHRTLFCIELSSSGRAQSYLRLPLVVGHVSLNFVLCRQRIECSEHHSVERKHLSTGATAHTYMSVRRDERDQVKASELITF